MSDVTIGGEIDPFEMKREEVGLTQPPSSQREDFTLPSRRDEIRINVLIPTGITNFRPLLGSEQVLNPSRENCIFVWTRRGSELLMCPHISLIPWGISERSERQQPRS